MKIDDENENLRKLKNQADNFETSTENLVNTIKTLQKNKNNIVGRVAEIREELIEDIGATKEEIPFIGELIKVKEDELAWEASIEKVLHNFALRLIVPPKYYSKVNEYVNANNLRGRIRYDKYEGQDYLKNFRNKKINEKSLVNKIDVKHKTQYEEWIENYLESQFNFVCVDNLSEFERYSEMAITQNALIKFRKGKHEKDDRPHISKKENYVLGWDNKEKIAALKKELISLQNQQAENKKAITNKNAEIKKIGLFKEDCQNLFSIYVKYDEIDWQTYANQIQEKIELKEALEKTNDRVKILQEQLEKVQTDLKQLSEVEIKNKDRAIFLAEARNDKVDETINSNKTVFEFMGNIDISEFEIQNPKLLAIEYDNFEASRKKFQAENLNETRKHE